MLGGLKICKTTFTESSIQTLYIFLLNDRNFRNCNVAFIKDFVELPPDDMQKLLVHNTVSIINIKIARWLNEVSNYLLPLINYVMGVVWSGNTS